MEARDLLLGRIQDLSRRAFSQNYLTHTDFLSASELACFYEMQRGGAWNGARFLAYGGHDDAERQVLCFLPDYLSTEDFLREEQATGSVLKCLHVLPVNRRFSEPLSHRDYLGALMHLQIAREVIGDILIDPGLPDASDPEIPRSNSAKAETSQTFLSNAGKAGQNTASHRGEAEYGAKYGAQNGAASAGAYIFVLSQHAEHLAEELVQVRHTTVQCTVLPPGCCRIRPRFLPISGSVASPRLDAVLAMAYHLSRGRAQELILRDAVSIDGCSVLDASRLLREHERVSVRGFGKFIYDGTEGQSRKGRSFVRIRRYL